MIKFLGDPVAKEATEAVLFFYFGPDNSEIPLSPARFGSRKMSTKFGRVELVKHSYFSYCITKKVKDGLKQALRSSNIDSFKMVQHVTCCL